MRFNNYIRSRKAATELGIVAAVGLFFVAGIFFESRRSSGRLPDVIGDAGAVSVPTSVPADGSSGTEEAVETPVAQTSATATAVPGSGSSSVLPGTPNPGAVGKQVFLDINGVENESVVEASTVSITGSTTPDALLSINGQAVEVELDGSFTIDIGLEPGPNFIEVVSSNLRGQETSRVISVVSIQ